MITPGAGQFLSPLARLLATVRVALDLHVYDCGRWRACQAIFPCERACLAELAPAAF
jgi:hypothetical protein